MNFQLYINNLKTPLTQFENSADFKIKYVINPPAYEEDISDMEAEIALEEGMEDFKVWEPIHQFYQEVNGFNFFWEYTGNRDSDRFICGVAQIPIINAIYEPEDEIGQPFKLLYERYRLFDDIDAENQVYLKFYPGKPEPELFYYVSSSDTYYLMSINFVEYLELLLEVKGLALWQEFFIADENFRSNPEYVENFFKNLELLFPDVDKAKFSPRI